MVNNNFWQNKKVLVTGGHGFLGKHLVQALEKKGCNPVVPSSNDYDLCFPMQIQAMLQDVGEIDVLFHLAADVGGIGYNQAYPYDLFYKNAIMGVNLIHLSVNKVKKFVQIGTACSYPEYCPTPFHEANFWQGYPEATNAAYALAKKMLLIQLQAARQQYGFNGIYVIPANLYGPGDNFNEEKSHVIPALIKKILEAKDTVEVWGTGNASRDFLYVEDAARGIILAAEKYNELEPLNLGSGKIVKIAALVNMVKAIAESNARTIWKADRPDGQYERHLDNSRSWELLGWKPEINLYDGLKKTIEWYQRNIEDVYA